MDGDSGDEGNNELTCVKSDESHWCTISRQAKFLRKNEQCRTVSNCER